MSFKIDSFLQAKGYTPNGNGTVKRIVIHDAEAPETGLTAENIARYFTTTDRASAHYSVDNNSIVQSVREKDRAWHCGYNSNSIGIELAGYASQTRAQWLDAYSRDMFERAAWLVADIARRHGVPIRLLTNAELAAGKSGITTHAQMSDVFKRSNHRDPGKNFPMEFFMDRVKAYAGGNVKTAPAPKVNQANSGYLTVDGQLGKLTIAETQKYLNKINGAKLAVDGVIGKNTIKALQKWAGTPADGIFGANSARALEKKLGLKAEKVKGFYPGLIRGLQNHLNAQKKAGKY